MEIKEYVDEEKGFFINYLQDGEGVFLFRVDDVLKSIGSSDSVRSLIVKYTSGERQIQSRYNVLHDEMEEIGKIKGTYYCYSTGIYCFLNNYKPRDTKKKIALKQYKKFFNVAMRDSSLGYEEKTSTNSKESEEEKFLTKEEPGFVYNISDVSKMLNLNLRFLVQELILKKHLYRNKRRSLIPNEKFIKKGYYKLNAGRTNNGKVVPHLKVTEKGFKFLEKTYGSKQKEIEFDKEKEDKGEYLVKFPKEAQEKIIEEFRKDFAGKTLEDLILHFHNTYIEAHKTSEDPDLQGTVYYPNEYTCVKIVKSNFVNKFNLIVSDGQVGYDEMRFGTQNQIIAELKNRFGVYPKKVEEDMTKMCSKQNIWLK